MIDRPWSRWQDWMAVIAGLYAALSPWWMITTSASGSTVIVLGILIVVTALIDLALPRTVWIEWIEVALGILLFLSPWVLTLAYQGGSAWTAWVTGGATSIVGAWAGSLVTGRHSARRRIVPAVDPRTVS